MLEFIHTNGAGCSSVVRRSWCAGSSDRFFKVDLLNYYSFQPVFHDWCNKGRGMCYPVYGMVHIKEPLLLIGKSSPCSGGTGFFSLYLSGPLPYVCHITVHTNGSCELSHLITALSLQKECACMCFGLCGYACVHICMLAFAY